MFHHKGHPAKAKPHEPSQGQQAFSCRILKHYQQRSSAAPQPQSRIRGLLHSPSAPAVADCMVSQRGRKAQLAPSPSAHLQPRCNA